MGVYPILLCGTSVLPFRAGPGITEPGGTTEGGYEAMATDAQIMLELFFAVYFALIIDRSHAAYNP